MLIKKRILTLLLAFISHFCYALRSDESQPVNITANSWVGDQKNRILTFSGRVVATRGSMVVNANSAQVTEDKMGNKTIHLIGTPVTFSQLNDDGERTEGQCNDFTYDTKHSLAILVGRARVKKGDNVVMGDKLTYNTKSQVYSAVANQANGINPHTSSGRVTVILQPTQKGSDGTTSSINFQ